MKKLRFGDKHTKERKKGARLFRAAALLTAGILPMDSGCMQVVNNKTSIQVGRCKVSFHHISKGVGRLYYRDPSMGFLRTMIAACGMKQDPLGIIPGKKLEGVIGKNRFVFTEEQWFSILSKLTRKICEGKTPAQAAQIIYSAVTTTGGALRIRYEKSERHPEGTAFRGIEVFAKRRGDCDETAYLFIMMARQVGLEAHAVGVLIDDRNRDFTGKRAGHAAVAVFLRGEKPAGAYEDFEKNGAFRRRTLRNIGMKDSPDLHMVLIDLTYQGGYGIRHRKVVALSPSDTTLMHRSDVMGTVERKLAP